jgi:membrane protease YdiL (CAAX protease family)
MTNAEQIAGWVFFLLYFTIFPFLPAWIARLMIEKWDIMPSDTTVSLLYYLFLLLVCLVVFHRFLRVSFSAFVQRIGASVKAILLGLVVYFGVSVLISRLTGIWEDPNQLSLSAQMTLAPDATLLLTLVLIPIVTEIMFRGLVYGSLAHRSRIVGYIVSVLLFAVLNVWQHIFLTGDWTYLILLVKYMVPGVILVWCYERSGTVWTPIVLHAGINGVVAFLIQV